MADALHERFAQFFAETRQGLLRYVQRLGQSREAAEDIAQEAYARTLEQAHHVQTPQAFLFVTARNLIFNDSRQQRNAPTETVADIDKLWAVESGDPSPEDEVIADEASQLLREAIERLPPKCRAAYALRVFHGCSYKEIADQLGISTKTVEKYIARGVHDTDAYLRHRYQLPDKEAGQPHE